MLANNPALRSSREAAGCLSEAQPQREIDLARSWLSQQRARLTADGARCARRTDVGGGRREVRMIENVHHSRGEPHHKALAVLELLQQAQVQIANRRARQDVES